MSKVPESSVSPPLAGSRLVKMTPASRSLQQWILSRTRGRGVGGGGRRRTTRDPYEAVGFDLRLPSRAQLSASSRSAEFRIILAE